jgi:hypothetical protein
MVMCMPLEKERGYQSSVLLTLDYQPKTRANLSSNHRVFQKPASENAQTKSQGEDQTGSPPQAFLLFPYPRHFILQSVARSKQTYNIS